MTSKSVKKPVVRLSPQEEEALLEASEADPIGTHFPCLCGDPRQIMSVEQWVIEEGGMELMSGVRHYPYYRIDDEDAACTYITDEEWEDA